jgi:hypothetical protein
MRAGTGTEDRVVDVGCSCAQFSAAEKGGKGMALKIFTEARPSPGANIKPFGIREIEMFTMLWNFLTLAADFN